MPSRSGLRAALVVSFVLTACTGSADPAPPSPGNAAFPAIPSGTAPIDTPSRSGQPTSPEAPSPSSAAGAVLDQPWATANLINVTTGKQFRIADMVASGKVVFLETMAIWCSNCRAQQVEAAVAFDGLDPEQVEWVAIDVESTETAEALARYREQNGFPFIYAIADTEFARTLVIEFGEIVLSPPSVNIIVIGTDRRITQLHGHKSADELRRLAAEHGAT
jgi:thiol-disulfide isomerase/thioredoxin